MHVRVVEVVTLHAPSVDEDLTPVVTHIDGKGPTAEVDAAVVRTSFEVNVVGAYLCSQALVPLMKKNGYGRIVNVSTGMAQLSEMNGNYPGYRISKVGLNALTKLMSDELQGTGIKVNAVDPGHVATDMGGPNGLIDANESVSGMMRVIDALDATTSGRFFNFDGAEIPW